MSLINDALKKAQRQRTEGSTPAPEIPVTTDSQEPLRRVARRDKPAGFRSQLILIGGGAAAAVALLSVGVFFFFRTPAEAPATTPKPARIASASPNAVVPTAPVAAAPTAVVTPVAAPVVAPQPVPPVATATVPAPTPATAPARVAPAPATTPVAFVLPAPVASAAVPAAAPAPAASAPAAAERPKPSTRMIGVIEHFRVGGIRVAGADSKVLMNDRVYRINDIVDFELGIRLTAIEPKALTFEDPRGAVHVRTF